MRMIIMKVSFLFSVGIAITMTILQPKYATANWWEWSGLVCYYKGDSLQDSSAAGNHLSAVGSGPHYETIASAPFSSSSRDVFSFNGSSGNTFYLKSSVASLPVANTPRTVMMWLRFDQAVVGTPSPFAYGGESTYLGFFLLVTNDRKTYIDVWGDVETNDGFIEDDYGPHGVWKHYAITWDGTNLLVYVNGVEKYTGTVNAALQTTLTDFTIGSRPSIASHPASYTLYAAIAEVAVFNRALTQNEITTVVNAGTAGGGGDPHMFGFGGVYFTWQGQCDIILTKAPKLNNTHPEVQIHARTRKTREWSSIESVAFKVGDDVGEIESDQGTLLVNGSNIKSYHTERLSVTFSKLKRKNLQYEIVFNKDKFLIVRANTRTNMLFVTLSGNYPEGTVGVLGSPHKPGTFARNGIDMTGQDINKFVETWQVTADDPKLFQNDRDPQYPTKCLYKMREIKARMRKARMQSRKLKEIHATTKEEAITACNDHPVGPLKDFCIEDMVNTGDFDTAADVFYG